MVKPGEVFDKKGVPIYPGDLLRSFHFRGRRWRKIYYLYHTVVQTEKTLEMVPTCHLEPTKVSGGGRCWLSQSTVDSEQSEIISGCGPEGYLDWTDRPKKRRHVSDSR